MNDNVKTHRPAEITALVPQAPPPLPVPSPEPVPPPPSIADFTANIRRLHSEFGEAASFMLAKAIEIGERLIAAKDALKHGKFEDYVTLECGIDPSTSQMYRKLAKGKCTINQWLAANPGNSRVLSQAQALKILADANATKRKGKPKTNERKANKTPATLDPPRKGWWPFR
ncbi:MAG: DUF3102 domain-containing protein [Roseiarcus sp.]|uniref:DUF3102 domain-containing protein n=1 Tax=Roseiarcus sp. TaxID=1969460 RepID=UPI003C6A61B6